MKLNRAKILVFGTEKSRKRSAGISAPESNQKVRQHQIFLPQYKSQRGIVVHGLKRTNGPANIYSYSTLPTASLVGVDRPLAASSGKKEKKKRTNRNIIMMMEQINSKRCHTSTVLLDGYQHRAMQQDKFIKPIVWLPIPPSKKKPKEQRKPNKCYRLPCCYFVSFRMFGLTMNRVIASSCSSSSFFFVFEMEHVYR